MMCWIVLYQYLPHIPTIANYVGSWMSTNNSYLNDLQRALTQDRYGDYSEWSTRDTIEMANRYLLYTQPFGHLIDGKVNGQYNWYYVRNNGQSITDWGYWQYGTPLGNIAFLLSVLNKNFVDSYTYKWNAMLTDYTGQLGIWDSQGDTLTQEAWSPTSAINGLYKYLAYTQRDVARLTYVLASDEEIATREKARETQTAVMDDFVDPDGAGAASVDDFGSISDASSGVQSNFNTGVSAGGVWNVFERNYEWFSQETADNLSYQPQRSTRNLKAAPDQEYDTPYLDSYYEELHNIIGF